MHVLNVHKAIDLAGDAFDLNTRPLSLRIANNALGLATAKGAFSHSCGRFAANAHTSVNGRYVSIHMLTNTATGIIVNSHIGTPLTGGFLGYQLNSVHVIGRPNTKTGASTVVTHGGFHIGSRSDNVNNDFSFPVNNALI